MKSIVLILTLFISISANADVWTPKAGSNVGVINSGALAGKSSYISLKDTTFTGCSRNDGAVLLEGNPNYSEIFSLLLAAKMSDKLVRIYHGGCKDDFSVIKQVYIL